MAYLNRRRRDQATPEGHDSGKTKESNMNYRQAKKAARRDGRFQLFPRGAYFFSPKPVVRRVDYYEGPDSTEMREQVWEKGRRTPYRPQWKLV